MKDVYEADAMTSQQLPNISIFNQDIVRVELHTIPLKGLSFRDLTLASIVDSFDLEKYQLVPLETEDGYKKVIRHMKIDEEMKLMEQEIRATEGIRKFGNKFQK